MNIQNTSNDTIEKCTASKLGFITQLHIYKHEL